MNKKLYRSRTNAMLAGVCGGIGEYFRVDPTLIRLLVVILVITGGIGILPYFICALIIPLRPQTLREEDISQYEYDEFNDSDW